MKRIWQVVVFAALVGVVAVTAGARGAAQRDTREPFVDPRTFLPSSFGVHYVCQVTLQPKAVGPIPGDVGSLAVTFTSGPNCTGASIGEGTIFSEGATSSLSDERRLYDQATLHAVGQMLQRAASDGQRVRWVRCGTGRTSCISSVSFVGTGVASTPAPASQQAPGIPEE